jgi:hypothetical protein
LKSALVSPPILIKLDFTRVFILDVDWSTHGVRAILSQRERKNEKLITYASKGFSLSVEEISPHGR